jgi:predicted alpha/beta-fold hydrolase
LDDPIIPPEALPYEEFQKSDWAILATTPHGGHVAWLQDGNMNSSFMDLVCVDFISAVTHYKDTTKNELS